MFINTRTIKFVAIKSTPNLILIHSLSYLDFWSISTDYNKYNLYRYV